MKPDEIVVVNGARTAVGSFGGALKDVPAHQLGAAASKAALTRAGVHAEAVDEVVMGCIGQVGADAYNARRVALSAGLPVSTPAYNVNRLCGSGLQAIWSAAMQIALRRGRHRAGRRQRKHVTHAVLRHGSARRGTSSVTASSSTARSPCSPTRSATHTWGAPLKLSPPSTTSAAPSRTNTRSHRSAGRRQSKHAPPSLRRSRRWSAVDGIPPWLRPMSIPAQTLRSRRWQRCARRSRTAALSPPEIPPESTTAPPR